MIAIGSDHAGYDLKVQVMAHLDEKGVKYHDIGCYNWEPIDYPFVAKYACEKGGKRRIQICYFNLWYGIGISMAANKVSGIRAAVCSDYFTAKYTRLHNDANVLCMGGRVIGAGVASEIVDVFLNTEFEGGRHQRRVSLIMDIEKE